MVRQLVFTYPKWLYQQLSDGNKRKAARIDGFPGVITALGTLRIRGDLLVASLSRSELAEALRSYAKALNVLPSNPASRNSSGLSLLTKLHLQSSSTPEEEAEVPAATNATTTATTTTVTAPTDSGPVNFTTNESASSLPSASTVPLPPPPPPPHQKSRSSLEVGEVFQTQPPPPLLPGGQKFVVSRLFLFDRMLLVTEEVKAKRKGTSADAFAQSTYQFRAAVNVNKMKFEPHWFMCTFTSEAATTGATGAGVADATPSGAAGAAVVPGNEQYAGTDWSSVRAALEFAASDDLRFALWDQTPGRDVIYIIDPQTVATRSAWVVHLRDIQRMQQQLLMALEDPTRFAGGEREWGKILVALSAFVIPLTNLANILYATKIDSWFICLPTCLPAYEGRRWPKRLAHVLARLGVGFCHYHHQHPSGNVDKIIPRKQRNATQRQTLQRTTEMSAIQPTVPPPMYANEIVHHS
ncbi:hypothetical protein TSMEX_007579 [Taenia solium]|eukprot:TsM_001197600 transcript=TsM_001197600 gene=TsM_001197600